MRKIKITTDCNFAGCDTEHFFIVPDDFDAEAFGEEVMMADINPGFEVEELDEDYDEDFEEIW